MVESDELITEVEAAMLRCQSPRTLQAERLHGDGCEYVKLGRSVRYRRSDVLRFIAARVVRSASETPPCAVRSDARHETGDAHERPA
jgi:hypothetical protein